MRNCEPQRRRGTETPLSKRSFVLHPTSDVFVVERAEIGFLGERSVPLCLCGARLEAPTGGTSPTMLPPSPAAPGLPVRASAHARLLASRAESPARLHLSRTGGPRTRGPARRLAH